MKTITLSRTLGEGKILDEKTLEYRDVYKNEKCVITEEFSTPETKLERFLVRLLAKIFSK